MDTELVYLIKYNNIFVMININVCLLKGKGSGNCINLCLIDK